MLVVNCGFFAIIAGWFASNSNLPRIRDGLDILSYGDEIKDDSQCDFDFILNRPAFCRQLSAA